VPGARPGTDVNVWLEYETETDIGGEYGKNVVPVVFWSNVIACGILAVGPVTAVDETLPDDNSSSFCPNDCVVMNKLISRKRSVPAKPVSRRSQFLVWIESSRTLKTGFCL
jgi:hypothetical protein